MKYKLQKDVNSWNIAERRIVGDKALKSTPGSVSYVAVKYYGSLKQAAISLLDIQTKENLPDAFAGADILTAIEVATAQVIEAVKETTN